MNQKDVKKYIVNWIKNVSGLTDNQVIFDYQNFPLPNDIFFKITTISNHKIFGEDVQENQIDGTIKIYKTREIVFSISAYNTGANDKAYIVWDSLNLESIRQGFKNNHISIQKINDLLDLSYKLDSNYVEKAGFTIDLLYTDEIIDNVGYFDKINVHEVFKLDNNILIEKDIQFHL